MALSDSGRVPVVVDLTNDSDSDSDNDNNYNGSTGAAQAAGPTRSAATLNGYAQAQTTLGGAVQEQTPVDAGHSAKRRRISTPSWQENEGTAAQAHPSAQSIRKPAYRHDHTPIAPARGAQALNRNSNSVTKLNTTINGAPSVHYMNSTLKASGPSSTLLARFSAPAARPLLLNDKTLGENALGISSPGLTAPESVTAIDVDADGFDDDVVEIVQLSPRQDKVPVARQTEKSPKPSFLPVHASNLQNEARDRIVSDVPVRQSSPQKAQRKTTSPPLRSSVKPTTPVPALLPNNNTPANTTEKADHLLIFLKEVKKLKWADITKEFQKDIPGRSYVQLQSRYSQTLNRRDRTQDPLTLSLPPRFAAEATINWETVHASTEGPRAPTMRRNLPGPETSRAPLISGVGRPRSTQHGRDDESSGTDSAPRRQKRTRAPPVKYTWPSMRTTEGGIEELVDDEGVNLSPGPNSAALSRSGSPAERSLVAPGARTVSHQSPLNMDRRLQDAKLGLSMQASCDSLIEHIPYLSATQRLAITNEAEECAWDLQKMQEWQGTVLHVDFNPSELQIVMRVTAEIVPSGPHSCHSTYRRHLRAILKGIPSPKLHKLAYRVRQYIRSRDLQSIVAFFEDAAAGMISDLPRVQRLATINHQSSKFSSVPKLSVPSMIRRRELGLQSRRGWQTATVPITYQQKNQLMDTIGPKSTWTGASSDIHTVAWSPDGQYFAAGAVAVTDPDSMQYNRPNVLMYGDTINGRIHELGEHTIKRSKVEAGANSTHAMHVSQDPKLFTTVSSVAFSPSGEVMYSAGYDNSVCIWDVTAGSRQPQLGRKLFHGAPVDILAVNPFRGGGIATATKRTADKTIKLITFNEETIYDDEWTKTITNFASAKALSRPDLNMSANALKFDPTGRLLLAGFGANMREDSGLDTSGDICLWDMETLADLHVYGSSRNVFDVTFNPSPRFQGLFAVGCVANGNVNKGTRSVVRFYSAKEKVGSSLRFTCPLELECKAFDMNDVVWCPHDANLFAAGCTDGRSYVWDLRRPDRVLYTLSHGTSLMPLQEGLPHERTDTGVRFLSWGQNARRLYSGSSDGMVKVWDVQQAQEDVFIRDLITTNSGIMSGAFTADCSKLIVGEVNGTANVLEVGRDDIALKDADKLQYQPYLGADNDGDDQPSSDIDAHVTPDLSSDRAAAEARILLNTGQLQLAPMGGLPRQQVIQGPNYQGPYDPAVDARYLREQATIFQRSMATTAGLQCDIQHCADSLNTTTYEEIGDSGRSRDRIPNEMRQQWLGEIPRTVPGKIRCARCSRPALPPTTADIKALCERCSFSCFRCGAAGSIGSSSSTFTCGSCNGKWDIGVLGYECIRQPLGPQQTHNVPALDKYGKTAYLERLEDLDTRFGDDVNALTDYYLGLTLDRPESPSSR